MSSAPAQSRLSVLIVGPLADKALADCAERLRRGGLKVLLVDDVYSAMAALASRVDLRKVVIDVCPLDRPESAFVELAPRYFPKMKLWIPLLSGTRDRLATLGLTAHATEIGEIESDLLGIDHAPVPSTEPQATTESDADAVLREAPKNEPAAAGEAPVNNSESDPEPSLHEAVRMRMAGNDPRMIRRKPPAAATPPVQRPPAATLSSEEVSALLGDASERRVDANERDDATGNT